MALSRRDFVWRLGAGGAAIASASHIIGYGREELFAFEQGQRGGGRPASSGPMIRLSSNENLRGPSPKVIEVLKAHPSKDLGLGYPPPNVSNFVDTIAGMYGAKPNNVIISTGSGEILTAAVMAYCNGDKSLVTGDPSYGSPAATAQRIKAPVKFIAVDSKTLALDLEGMIRSSVGAGLVFLCNPNNPTSTVQTTADIEQTVRTIKQRSPETGILIDEAYLEYATKPGSGTLVKLALELPGVFVSKTFSKAYGMAGMRMGYAVGQPETMNKVGRAWGLGSIN
jgi:histidinol-phosphate aminotransferase